MSDELEITRDELGRINPGQSSLNPLGRPKETEEKKLEKKAIKELILSYKEVLAGLLPDLPSILKAEAAKGNIQAIKEIHDRVMGKPEQVTDMTIGIKPQPIADVL